MNTHHTHCAPPPPSSSLARYESAPGSFFADLLSPGADAMMSRFFSGAGSGDATFPAVPAGPPLAPPPTQLNRSYGLPEISPAPATVAGGGSHLVRHSSSPAGFFAQLLVDPGNSATTGFGSFSQVENNTVQSLQNRSLPSQWSFSKQESLSQFSELSMPEIGENVSTDETAYISSNGQLGANWDDNSIVFSNKRAKDNNGNIVRSISNIESQFTSLDYLNLQPDSVACKVRAKRGCATHPRSIAERERRTRISKRLRNLQDLVPNMDKQTSTSDMLELAVKHINELQNQLQKLKQDQAKCTCGSKQVSTRA